MNNLINTGTWIWYPLGILQVIGIEYNIHMALLKFYLAFGERTDSETSQHIIITHSKHLLNYMIYLYAAKTSQYSKAAWMNYYFQN